MNQLFDLWVICKNSINFEILGFADKHEFTEPKKTPYDNFAIMDIP